MYSHSPRGYDGLKCLRPELRAFFSPALAGLCRCQCGADLVPTAMALRAHLKGRAHREGMRARTAAGQP